jgi:SRSO17 transposase
VVAVGADERGLVLRGALEARTALRAYRLTVVKSSADAVGAARQYSGTIGGIALCQVTVTVTYATGRGHALIGQALYLPGGCATDEEHRELAGALLDRARSLGIRAAFVAGDEVYGGRELRRSIRQRGMGYVLAVHANHAVTADSAGA